MGAFLDRIVGLIRRTFEKKTQYRLPLTKDFFKDKPFVIGDFTYGFPRVMLYGDDANLYIGNYCSIAQDVLIFLGGNHRVDWISTYPFAFNDSFDSVGEIKGHPSTKGDVKIGNDVWIGYGATILSGVTIGNGAVIGTRSVVAKNVPAYAVVVGNPAKIVKYRFTQEHIDMLEKIAWWNWPKEKVEARVIDLSSDNIENFVKENYNE